MGETLGAIAVGTSAHRSGFASRCTGILNEQVGSKPSGYNSSWRDLASLIVCGVGFGIMRQGLNEGASPVRAAFVEPSQAERSLNTFRNGPSERSSDAVITVGSIV
jgi:hypothetical protein